METHDDGVPPNGALIKLHKISLTPALYQESSKSENYRVKKPGLKPPRRRCCLTSINEGSNQASGELKEDSKEIFSGIETVIDSVNGVIGSIIKLGINVRDSKLSVGESVVIHSAEKDWILVQEVLLVPDLNVLVKLPSQIAPELVFKASKLAPIVPFFKSITKLVSSIQSEAVKILFVCNGGNKDILGIPLVQLLDQFIISSSRAMCLTVASIEDDIIMWMLTHKVNKAIQKVHWDVAAYEQDLMERTMGASKGVVDLVVCQSQTPRCIQLALKCVAKGGWLMFADKEKALSHLESSLENKILEKSQLHFPSKVDARDLEDLFEYISGQRLCMCFLNLKLCVKHLSIKA